MTDLDSARRGRHHRRRRRSAPPRRRGLAVAAISGVLLITAATIVLATYAGPDGDDAVVLDQARHDALAAAARSCPALTPARLAGQIMATTGFSGGAGIAGLLDAEWETWKPWDDARVDDEAANMLALAHLTCDLIGQVRRANVPGDPWRLAVAAFASSIEDVRAANGVPVSVANYVKQVETYTAWYAERLPGTEDSPQTPNPVTPSGLPTSSPSPDPSATETTTEATATPSGVTPTTSPAPPTGPAGPTVPTVPTAPARPTGSTPTTTRPPTATTPPLALNFPRFDSAAELYLNGSARIANGRLELTHALQQAGSAWARQTIDTSKSFTTSFSAVITQPTDGLALVIQAQGPQAIGTYGGGIGYGGSVEPASRIRPSVAIEVDTWQYNEWDPGAQHLAVTLNGDITNHVAWADPGFSMRENQPFYVWVYYDAGARRLSVYASQSSTRPATALFTYGIDLRAHLGTDRAYLGFTGATGLTNLTDSAEVVLSWSASSG